MRIERYPGPLPPSGRYYVDASGGNDSNSGMATDQAWRTLAKVDSVTFPSGSTIYFKRGQTWTNIDLGISQSNLTFDAYGVGALPVMDGVYLHPDLWQASWEFSGNNTTIRNIRFVRSASMPIRIYGATLHGVSGFTVDGCEFDGIVIGVYTWGCDDVIIRNCIFSHCNRINDPAYSGYAPGLWAADITHRLCDGALDERNLHFEGFGEVVNTNGGCSNITIQDNVAYDFFGPTFYPVNASHSLIQRNLSYCTQNSTYFRNGDAGSGIATDNEVMSYGGGVVEDATFINNLCIGHSNNFAWYNTLAGEGFVDSLIANNTFVDAFSNGLTAIPWNIYFSDGLTHVNSRFVNNLILQDDLSCGEIYCSTNVGMTWDHNAWKTLPAIIARGLNDYIGTHIMLMRTGTLGPGLLTADYFKIQDGSGCIDAGLALAEVTEDFWGTARGTPPCIGAHEFVGGTPTPEPKNISYLANGAGDNFWWYTGYFTNTDSYSELGNAWGSSHHVGLRFDNVIIPVGSQIVSAKITIFGNSSSSNTNTVHLKIRGVDADDPSAPTTEIGANALSLTTANALWDALPPWSVLQSYDTSDLTFVIQELVDNHDYSAGAAMEIIIEDNSSTAGANRQTIFNNLSYPISIAISYWPPV